MTTDIFEALGLDRNPFSMAADTEGYFHTDTTKQILDELSFGILSRKGFLLLTGEVGVGKTSLLYQLLRKLEKENLVTSWIFNTMLNKEELLHAIARDFGLDAPKSANVAQLIDLLQGYLVEQNAQDKNCAIIVDEAHNLSLPAMEALRMLSNLEVSGRKLVQILLVGQPELKERLDEQKLRQLRSRISIFKDLRAFNQDETGRYVNYKLSSAASQFRMAGQPLKILFQATEGNTRMINLIMERALYAAVAFGVTDFTPKVLQAAVNEIAACQVEVAERMGRSGKRLRVAVVAGVAALLLAAVLVPYIPAQGSFMSPMQIVVERVAAMREEAARADMLEDARKKAEAEALAELAQKEAERAKEAAQALDKIRAEASAQELEKARELEKLKAEAASKELEKAQALEKLKAETAAKELEQAQALEKLKAEAAAKEKAAEMARLKAEAAAKEQAAEVARIRAEAAAKAKAEAIAAAKAEAEAAAKARAEAAEKAKAEAVAKARADAKAAAAERAEAAAKARAEAAKKAKAEAVAAARAEALEEARAEAKAKAKAWAAQQVARETAAKQAARVRTGAAEGALANASKAPKNDNVSLTSVPKAATYSNNTNEMHRSTRIDPAYLAFLKPFGLESTVGAFAEAVETKKIGVFEEVLPGGVQVLKLDRLPADKGVSISAFPWKKTVNENPTWLVLWRPPYVIQDFYYGYRHEDILAMQLKLKKLGYYWGPDDGMVGPVTWRAINSFQKDMKLKRTMWPDAETIFWLQVMARQG